MVAYSFSDEIKVVLDKDCKVYIWRESDIGWRPKCLGMYSGHSLVRMYWPCFGATFIYRFRHLDLLNCIYQYEKNDNF